MQEPTTLKEGEKYLTIDLTSIKLKDLIIGKIAVFSNKEGRAKNPQAPHFKGTNVSVWINKKKANIKNSMDKAQPEEEFI